MDTNSEADGSKRDQSRINRRRFIQALGTTGGTTAVGTSGISTALAKQSDINSGTVNRIIRRTESKRILEEVGDPNIVKAEATRTSSSIDDAEFETVKIPTTVGTLIHSVGYKGSPDEIEEFFLTLELADSTRPSQSSERKQLPQKFQNVPADTGARMTVTRANRTLFARSATKNEAKVLSNLTGISVANLESAVDSRRGSFTVTNATDTNERYRINVGEERPAFDEVPTSILNDATAEPLATTQADCDSLYNKCLGDFVVVAGCQGLCATIPLTTIAGLFACISCNAAAGAKLGNQCGRFLKNCG